jgi:hypothetical protein
MASVPEGPNVYSSSLSIRRAPEEPDVLLDMALRGIFLTEGYELLAALRPVTKATHYYSTAKVSG